MRKSLHECVHAMEAIDPGEVDLVNTFSRTELMKNKTRELTALLCAFVPREKFNHFIELQDQYDHLAIDWVYGNELEWDGSIVDNHVKKIISEIDECNKKTNDLLMPDGASGEKQ